MSGLATLRTRDGLSYKMPAGNITKAALDSAFHIDARAIECHGVAITPSTNGVFYGALPDHTYTVYARDTGERERPMLVTRVGMKMVGRRHVPTREETRKVFVHYDRDNSGAIDMAEFRALVASLGLLIAPEEVENTFRAIDLDGNGTLEFEEFFQWFHEAKKHKNNPIREALRKTAQKVGAISITDPEVVRKAFVDVDTDGSGAIDPDEFMACCTNLKLKMSEAEARALFAALDTDGNGTLDFAEFYTWWKSMTRGDGHRSLLAHNLQKGLYEKAAASMAAAAGDDDEDEDGDGEEGAKAAVKWSELGDVKEGWELPGKDTKLCQAAWCRKSSVVMLRGCVVAHGEAGKSVATLPDGARPAATERFQCMLVQAHDKHDKAKGRAAMLTVEPSGSITVQPAKAGELWLSGVVFAAA